jgi:hypothetical protein
MASWNRDKLNNALTTKGFNNSILRDSSRPWDTTPKAQRSGSSTKFGTSQRVASPERDPIFRKSIGLDKSLHDITSVSTNMGSSAMPGGKQSNTHSRVSSSQTGLFVWGGTDLPLLSSVGVPQMSTDDSLKDLSSGNGILECEDTSGPENLGQIFQKKRTTGSVIEEEDEEEGGTTFRN